MECGTILNLMVNFKLGFCILHIKTGAYLHYLKYVNSAKSKRIRHRGRAVKAID